MNNDPIRIMLVDDHKIVRKSWKSLLENNPRFQVVADCENGQEAIETAAELLPDIILVDINMTPLNGFAVAERVIEKSPSIKVIGLSVNNQPKYAAKMIGLGARGYLTKTSSLEEINHGILEVYRGQVYICKEVTKDMPHK
ncbi:MAG: response regulator transcription factor [Bacteroidota bacterium]